ncbi:MAG: M1 family metallopeptidase [Saprospiraceae bacterium]|nr:M1 family metallopeptidase [Candidatus Opimibacter skivensis]
MRTLYSLSLCLVGLTGLMVNTTSAQQTNKFEQLGTMLPTPNSTRSASGAPGAAYWQQKADYVMEIHLDDNKQKISGKETITYHNQSPDALSYLWLQLDQNQQAEGSDSYSTQTGTIEERVTPNQLARLERGKAVERGFNILTITDAKGVALPFTINKTMMRVDLPKPLAAGASYSFKVSWWYNINDRFKEGGRSGYEFFPKDSNYLYAIAQFFPRMCVYDDINGWQNKQFLGGGEFTLVFGDYDVKITVPADHAVAATGTLHNAKEVLTKTQYDRLTQAQKSYVEPVKIITNEEAVMMEASRIPTEKTWHFKATNVRDFAFASSRKFIWDAMAVKQAESPDVMAMSMYPKEGNPLWEMYSTKVIAHTLKWYSHYTVDYPYPVAWSIHTDRIGMEYPMIAFNGGRPNEDGTYSDRTKYGMIGVILHEVGHNYFPMIINSDERQWTWMDEGLNTFVQFLTEQQWERDYPSGRGPAFKIVDYMKADQDQLEPIMSNSENIKQLGSNAYAKTATALNILRETVMGRELFDKAFKEYAQRWKFKHPSPADFFRTMEDASAVDLDWFWRGWFFSTEPCDIELADVQWQRADRPEDPSMMAYEEKYIEEYPLGITSERNRKSITQTQDEIDRSLRDQYTDQDKKKEEQQAYDAYVSKLSPEEKAVVEAGNNYYSLTFKNKGGLPMPIILKFVFADSTEEVHRIPAEIWRKNNEEVSKVFVTDKVIKQINLDPYLETADIDRSNNYYPSQQQMSRFELYRQQRGMPPGRT